MGREGREPALLSYSAWFGGAPLTQVVEAVEKGILLH